jgi:hypothetical protein
MRLSDLLTKKKHRIKAGLLNKIIFCCKSWSITIFNIEKIKITINGTILLDSSSNNQTEFISEVVSNAGRDGITILIHPSISKLFNNSVAIGAKHKIL